MVKWVDNKLAKIFKSILIFIYNYKHIIFIGLVILFLIYFGSSIYTLLDSDKMFIVFLVLVFIGFLVAILSTINSWKKNKTGLSKKDIQNLQSLSYKGQWFSGTAGVILTSLTFLLISLTFYYQFKEFKRGQYQTSENNFYKFVDIYNTTTESLKIPQKLFKDSTVIDSTLIYDGRNVFKTLYKEFKFEYNNLIIQFDTTDNNDAYLRKIDSIRIDSSFNIFYKKFQPYLGRYFRTLYYPLYFAKRHNLRPNFTIESYLTKTLRAQISNYELLMLFYYCLTRSGGTFAEKPEKGHGGEELCEDRKCEFKNLVEEYHMLKFIRDDEDALINKGHLRLYHNSAYNDTLKRYE